VSYLSSVLASAKPVYGIDYIANPATDARPLLLQMGLIGKSKRRSRRLVSDELDRLLVGLEARSGHVAAKIPFVDILNFSILSCMRVGEVCKIRWEDIDEKQKAVLVRDRRILVKNQVIICWYRCLATHGLSCSTSRKLVS